MIRLLSGLVHIVSVLLQMPRIKQGFGKWVAGCIAPYMEESVYVEEQL